MSEEYIVTRTQLVEAYGCGWHDGLDDGLWSGGNFLGDEVLFPMVTRCRDCRWLGRESIVPGEHRCNRTERVTGLNDYCSKAVRRDA